MVKSLFLLIVLAVPARAVDLCYIFERGSESWYRCKESVADSDRINDQLSANLRNIVSQGNVSGAMYAAEDNRRAFDIFMKKRYGCPKGDIHD